MPTTVFGGHHQAQKGPHKSSEEIVILAAGAARGVAESLGFLEIGSLLVQLGGLAPKGNPFEGEIHESHNMPRRFTPYSPNMRLNLEKSKKGGLLFVQQEICAAAAASATGMEEARLQGKDLEAQTIAAVDAVMVDLPKNQGVALQCLAASFSAGLGTAGAKSSIKAAETAAWKALIRSELNETQRQEGPLKKKEVCTVALVHDEFDRTIRPHPIRGSRSSGWFGCWFARSGQPFASVFHPESH
eukprot:symbB.v1.2.034630.t1/scaffold4505.1/size38808/1